MIVDVPKRETNRIFVDKQQGAALNAGDSHPEFSGCVRWMSWWLDDLLREISVPVVVVLEGGHYDPRSGADLFSRNSLRCALTMGRETIERYGRRVRVVYGVLVDDLGLDCDASSCRLLGTAPTGFDQVLPAELEAILQRDRFVKRDRLIVSTERHSRNRGLKQLKRLLEGDKASFAEYLTIEERDGANHYVMRADDGLTIQVATRVASRWTVKCPLIMASHYAELVENVEQRFGQRYAIVIVDFSEISDRGKVTRGSELALRAFVPAGAEAARRSILNVFWADESGELYLTDSFHDCDLRST